MKVAAPPLATTDTSPRQFAPLAEPPGASAVSTHDFRLGTIMSLHGNALGPRVEAVAAVAVAGTLGKSDSAEAVGAGTAEGASALCTIEFLPTQWLSQWVSELPLGHYAPNSARLLPMKVSATPGRN
jgi:hypothetical protein